MTENFSLTGYIEELRTTKHNGEPLVGKKGPFYIVKLNGEELSGFGQPSEALKVLFATKVEVHAAGKINMFGDKVYYNLGNITKSATEGKDECVFQEATQVDEPAPHPDEKELASPPVTDLKFAADFEKGIARINLDIDSCLDWVEEHMTTQKWCEPAKAEIVKLRYMQVKFLREKLDRR